MTVCPELEVPITQAQVVGMVTLLQHRFPDLKNLTVQFTKRKPRTRCAVMYHCSWRIVFHLNGLTEETVLHEIAHCLCPPSEHHGARWHAKMLELCKWWKESLYKEGKT